MNTKGIILAGGKGQRLGKLTTVISKQMLPVFKQPMIYYPLKTLIDMGIDDVLIIVSSVLQQELFSFQLGDGSKFGINIRYIVQESPNGLAEAFIIGEEFIGDSNVTLILGDNVILTNSPIICEPNTIFTYKVKDPSAYGVAKLGKARTLVDIVEKPKEFVSNDAVIGLYVFNNKSVQRAKTLKPSLRGELEIVDLIKLMQSDGINVQELNGFWYDCGTPDDLLECAEFVRTLAKRTSRDIFLEEI
jgi:glucose-1-phosphate thymidylyltransferase